MRMVLSLGMSMTSRLQRTLRGVAVQVEADVLAAGNLQAAFQCDVLGQLYAATTGHGRRQLLFGAAPVCAHAPCAREHSRAMVISTFFNPQMIAY